MATFEITIDDSLAPGIIATASLEGKTPEEVVNEAAAAAGLSLTDRGFVSDKGACR